MSQSQFLEAKEIITELKSILQDTLKIFDYPQTKQDRPIR
jgi:hypothetical protein